MAIIGLVVLFGCVFGGYILAGGSMAPIIHAVPHEMIVIGGAAVGAMLIGNSMGIVVGAIKGAIQCITGPRFKKQDYCDCIFLVSKLMKVFKAEGAVALESHIENPESSGIFGEYPRLLKDHALVHLIADTVRLMVISSSNLDANAVEDLMEAAIKNHHHNALKPAAALSQLEGALPALGIVACVLGVVKTMGAIDQPPPVLGGLIGGALVGTFLGVFLAYGLVGPLANRLGQIVDEEGEIYKIVKQVIVGTLNNYPIPVIIEASRACLSHHNQPSFSEVFDGLRGK